MLCCVLLFCVIVACGLVLVWFGLICVGLVWCVVCGCAFSIVFGFVVCECNPAFIIVIMYYRIGLSSHLNSLPASSEPPSFESRLI